MLHGVLSTECYIWFVAYRITEVLSLFFSGIHVHVKVLNMNFTSTHASWIDHGRNLWNLNVAAYRWKEGGNKEKWRGGPI